MAAPNLAAPKKIVGKVAFAACTSTNEVTILSNGTASSACLRVTSLTLANVDGSSAVDATVRLYNAASGGTAYRFISTLNVPADSSVVVVGRDNAVYLEEDRRITVAASAADDLEVVCSYEEVT
jgi:hypothetical protein